MNIQNTVINYESLLSGTQQTLSPPHNTNFDPAQEVPASFRPDAASAMAYVQQHQLRLLAKLFEIGPKTQERLNKVKHRLRMPFKALTKAAHDIASNTSLSKKQKKARMEELRKASGLSRKEMRELVTGRLEKIYAAAKKEAQSYYKSVRDNLETQLKEVELTHGADSPAATQVRSQIERVDQVFQPYMDRLESNRSFLKSLYGGKSCIKRTFGAIGSAFKKVGSALKTAVKWSPIGLLNHVPLIKNFTSPIISAVNRAIDFAARPLHLIKQAVSWIKSFVQHPWSTIKRGVSKVGEFLKKNWTWLTPLALNFVPVVGPALSRIARPLLRAYRLGKMAYQQGKQIYQNVKTVVQGTWAWAKETATNWWVYGTLPKDNQ